jgi:hypothetical protein
MENVTEKMGLLLKELMVIKHGIKMVNFTD